MWILPLLFRPQYLLQVSFEAALTLCGELQLWFSVGINGAVEYSELEIGKLLYRSFSSSI